MINYNLKKQKNQLLFDYIQKYLSEQGGRSVLSCGWFMEFVSTRPDGIPENLKRRLIRSYSCKNRFCPLCAWKKAKKDSLINAVMMQYLYKEHDKEFIFVMLSVPNVAGDELRDKISQMNRALKKMFERKMFKQMNKGYIRKFEVTYNKDRDDYHPHIHLLIAVNKSYFTSRDYINQTKWLDNWRDVMQDDTIMIVDVRKVYGDFQKGAMEMSKYMAKDADYLHNEDVFNTFYNALKGLRLTVYDGLFKKAKALYAQDKLDKYKEQDPNFYELMEEYIWGRATTVDQDTGEVIEGTEDEYVLQELREMSDDELAKWNGNTVGEMDDFEDD